MKRFGLPDIIGQFPAVFQRILAEAFGLRQAVAGGFCAVIMNGAKRGLSPYIFVGDPGDIGVGLMTIFNMIVLIPLLMLIKNTEYRWQVFLQALSAVS